MATGQYEMKWRAYHSTVFISDRLYCWGGNQEDLAHYDDKKKKFTSSVDIFRLPALQWESKSTTATPPAGVIHYACTNVKNNIVYFGGSCKPLHCFHNDLFELNTVTNEWREIINSSPDNGPMRKHGCGIITIDMNAEDNLLVIGGFGPTPITTHTGSKYTSHPNIRNHCLTNEIHTMCVNSSPGQWKVPIIAGNRPPPCAYFTINTLPGNIGIMFGGFTINETGFHRLNDIFLLSFSQNTIDFHKVVKSSNTALKWPKARNHHASTVINTISSNQQIMSHLVVLGGLDKDNQILNDCWLMNLSSFIWYKINLPDSVTNRFYHSMSTYYISKERFWIVVTGGCNEYNQSDDTAQPITKSNVTMIIELEYINDVWSVKHVWNREQLMKNKDEIQTSLLHHIVDDRLQEGTLVTDLIDSIKSSSSIPHQETQKIMEKRIFDQFSYDRLHQQKQLQVAQQELQMLQKDAGKKLHDNEMEIKRHSLELMREKKRSTDLESELLSVQVIADNRDAYISQLTHDFQEKYHILSLNIQDVKKQLENMKKQEQRKEGELLQVRLDLWGKDETLKATKTRETSLQHMMEKLKQEWELKLSAKELDIRHKHQQLSLLNNNLGQSKEKVELLESHVTKLNQTTEKWKKDCEIAQHQLSIREMAADCKHQKLNDELKLNQQKVKHLESNITKLYQTAEIWKKASQHQLQEIKESRKQIRHVTDLENIHLSDNSEEVYRIAIPEKSELEELTHSEYQPFEDIKGSYVESGLKEPHELGLEIREMRRDLQKELKWFWSEAVCELQTELRNKEEVITQIENENKQFAALQRELQEEKQNIIDSESPKVQTFQCFEETKTYKDVEVQVDYLVHLTDRLSSVHVAAQKQFLIQGSKRQVFDWEQFGFKMKFQQGTLHQSETCEVAVKALVGGTFQFPQDTQLVSATYAISFAAELLQPVMLEIQHCVLLKSKEQFKYLSFMIAQIDESAPPYKFQLVKGGKFNIDNQYGTITRQKFCLVGIGKTSSDCSSDDTSTSSDDPPSDDETHTHDQTNTTSDNETHTHDQTNTTSNDETHTHDQTNTTSNDETHTNDQTNTTSNDETHTNDQTNTTSNDETHTNDQTNTTSDSETHTESDSESVLSVHEDTTAFHCDIEDMPSTHTEQDNKIVFETHENDDESPSVGSDNEIKMKCPYPSLDLLYEFDRRFQDIYCTNNDVFCDETSFDIDEINVPSTDNTEEHPSSDADDKTPPSSEHVDVLSTDNTEEHPSNTGDNTPPSSGRVDVPSTDNTEDHPSSDTDDKTPSSSGHADIQSTDKVEKGNDSSSDTDSETQTHHSISKGAQVPNDSGVPDNTYTGRIYYERRGSNKWLMMFMVVQKIKVFLEFISAKHPTAIEDQIIRFSFIDSKTGYIELLLQDSHICNGWYIEPHIEPLKLMKRDADLFGSNDLPIPPSCLITVWAKLSCDPEERLRHPVTLTGIDCNTRKIYISRFLETSTTESTRDQVQDSSTTNHAITTPHTGTDRSHVDISQVLKCIELVMEKNHAKLTRLFKTGSLKTVADELLEAGIITRDVQTNPTSDNIINCFLSGFVFKDELEEIEEYCTKFFNAFYEIRGPYVDAANKIKKSMQESVRDKLGIQLNV